MAQQQYQQHLQMSTTSEKLKNAAWNVDEYHQLYQTGQNILQDLNTVLSNLEAGLSCDTVIGDVPGTNVPLALTKLRSILQRYLKDLFKKKCKPATDILVFLISESTRAKKPYAIPTQCIPHAGLQDQEVRAIANGIKLEMTKIGMKVESKKLNSILGQNNIAIVTVTIRH